jgi:hypothetical protein
MVHDKPFVDRPMAATDVADRAATSAAASWALDEPVLLRRGMNALYACGRVVLRVGHTTAPARLAHDLVTVMRAHGVPTVAPIAGLTGSFEGVSVTAWERVAPVEATIDWAVVGASVRLVHEVDPGEIPDGYPVPSPALFPWWDFDALLADVADSIDGPALRGIETAIRRHDGWQPALAVDAVVCHGDVHPGNVLVSATGPLLIDWDLLCRAAPAWDHAMLTSYADRWGGDVDAYPAFAEGYGANMADDELTIALADLRNVAATLMRVRSGRSSPAAAEEANRRLRYWRGDHDAPMWRSQ